MSARQRLVGAVRVALLGAWLGAWLVAWLPAAAAAQHLLLPMDDAQRNHLKAYGVAFAVLKAERKSEWFLNYRGGSFLIPDLAEFRKRSTLDGVSFEPVDAAGLAAIRAEMAGGNMESVVLERAPRIAIYTPPNAPPWDDAVTLALEYAGIEFTKIYDEEVLGEGLAKIDWVHLFHEDFTGQLNKLHITYRDQPWFLAQRQQLLGTARRLGYANVPSLKKAVADRIRGFVEKGGFLFAMCGATETLDLAIAARTVDIAGPFADDTPVDDRADEKLDWPRALAFQNAHIEKLPFVNSMSDIDGHQVNVPGCASRWAPSPCSPSPPSSTRCPRCSCRIIAASSPTTTA